QLTGTGRRFDEDAGALGQSGPGGRLATGDFDRRGRGLGHAAGTHADLGPALRLLGVVRPDFFGVLLSHARILSSWVATRVAKAPRCGACRGGTMDEWRGAAGRNIVIPPASSVFHSACIDASGGLTRPCNPSLMAGARWAVEHYVGIAHGG